MQPVSARCEIDMSSNYNIRTFPRARLKQFPGKLGRPQFRRPPPHRFETVTRIGRRVGIRGIVLGENRDFAFRKNVPQRANNKTRKRLNAAYRRRIIGNPDMYLHITEARRWEMEAGS